MHTGKPDRVEEQLTHLCQRYARGDVSRREFMRDAVAIGMAGAAAATLGSLVVGTGQADAALAQQTAANAARKISLDLAEWNYMWVNVKRAETAKGTFVGGQQMYVEYM